MDARLRPVDPPVPEPLLSPELALVDPELAAWANARLDPTRGLAAGGADRFGRPALRLAPAPKRDPETADEPSPRAAGPAKQAVAPRQRVVQLLPAAFPPVEGSPAPRKARWRALVRGALIAVVAAGIGFAAGRAWSPDVLDGTPVQTAGPARAESPRGAPGSAGPASPSEPTPTVVEETSPEAAPAPGPGATGAPSANRDALASTPAGDPRELAWLPVDRATHYRVELYRGPRQILVSFPVEPRLTVPGSWSHRGTRFSLEPGSYRWVVRPGFGTRLQPSYGAPTVSSALVVRS